MQDKDTWTMFRRIISTVHHSHQKGTVHRSLKLEDFLDTGYWILNGRYNSVTISKGVTANWKPSILHSTFQHLAPKIPGV
jgi:serine/threonine protein kinase